MNESTDPKSYRTETGTAGDVGLCLRCMTEDKAFRHSSACKHATVDDLRWWVNYYKRRAEWAGKRAKHWLFEVRTMHGKLSLMSGELRRLRKKQPRRQSGDCIKRQSAGRSVSLMFIPQEWHGNTAASVSPPQGSSPYFTVPLDEFIEKFANEDEWLNDHEKRDSLRLHRSAPEWVREWCGPFEVTFGEGEIGTGDASWVMMA